MAITLNPAVTNLGIMAPVVGPWFSQPSVTLDVLDPTKKLGLTVNFAASTDWYAPATGTLSLYVTDGSNPPAALDALQDSDGTWPFPNGRLVAFFRLLPEVETRLHELMGLVPAATSSPVGTPPTTLNAPTRQQVRSFAMLLPAATPLTPAGLFPFFGGAAALPGTKDAERITALGLATDSGGALTNGAVPMTWLRRPGGATAKRDKMLQGLNGAVDLWVFDRRGRAIDPGAVAAWWSWLLNTAVGDDPATGATDFQLIAPGMVPSDYPQSNALPVVAMVTAQRTLHLVDAHEGRLGSPFINGRLQNGGAAVTGNLVQPSGTNASLTFSTLPAPGATPPPDNPQLDDAPRARIAVLPAGTYGAAANVWPGGPVHAALTRDFVRVAVVEEESHLVGVTRRDSRAAVATPSDRRQSAQNRPSTRINVGRTATTNGVLLANGQLAANALLALPNAANPTRLVLGIADTAWGGTPGTTPPAAGTPNLPASLADSGAGAVPTPGQYRVRALAGGGALAGDHQTVLVEVNLGSVNAGAWVRIWPLGFDLTNGLHFRLTGGAGRADANGVAQLVMVLAPGKVDAAGLIGMDMLVLLTDAVLAVVARRSYADRRFNRPAPLPGTPATGISGTWVVCETGVSNSGALPAGAVPPGGHVVLLGSPPTIVDRTVLPAAAWDANTLRNRLRAADIVSLTTPSFGSTPDRADVTGRPLPRTPTTGGDPRGGIDTIVGTRLHLLNRTLLSGVTASSVPYVLLGSTRSGGGNDFDGGYSDRGDRQHRAGSLGARTGCQPLPGSSGRAGIYRDARHRRLAHRRASGGCCRIRARANRGPGLRPGPGPCRSNTVIRHPERDRASGGGDDAAAGDRGRRRPRTGCGGAAHSRAWAGRHTRCRRGGNTEYKPVSIQPECGRAADLARHPGIRRRRRRHCAAQRRGRPGRLDGACA